MAKKATAKADAGKKSGPKRKAARTSERKPAASKPRRKSSSANDSGSDAIDALLKLLQSPLVLDLLAVGATAAVAAITEERSARRTGSGAGGKALKSAGKAAASAIGRRLATEFEEVRKASKKASEAR